eukprot:GILI01020724.1.p1 GENE.GILI01020724.1~~GILI01020724.1.p1  ORF type:complete len:142 (+),score=33.74 GILI01020724.1:55-426(+)
MLALSASRLARASSSLIPATTCCRAFSSSQGEEKRLAAFEVFQHFDLGNRKRATITKIDGIVHIDIRRFFFPSDGRAPNATKQGITLSVEQWETLKKLAPSIDQAVASYKSTSTPAPQKGYDD